MLDIAVLDPEESRYKILAPVIASIINAYSLIATSAQEQLFNVKRSRKQLWEIYSSGSTYVRSSCLSFIAEFFSQSLLLIMLIVWKDTIMKFSLK